MSVGKLIGENADEERICLVRKDERLYIPLQPDQQGAHAFEALAANRMVKRMEPFIVRPLMEFSEPLDTSQNTGDQFLHVIRGKVEVRIDDRTIILSAGDSLYFDASIPHKTRSLSKHSAEMLFITAN